MVATNIGEKFNTLGQIKDYQFLWWDMNRKKPWLKNYPENTPEEIVIDPRKTLVRVLDEAETEYPLSLIHI